MPNPSAYAGIHQFLRTIAEILLVSMLQPGVCCDVDARFGKHLSNARYQRCSRQEITTLVVRLQLANCGLTALSF